MDSAAEGAGEAETAPPPKKKAGSRKKSARAKAGNGKDKD